MALVKVTSLLLDRDCALVDSIDALVRLWDLKSDSSLLKLCFDRFARGAGGLQLRENTLAPGSTANLDPAAKQIAVRHLRRSNLLCCSLPLFVDSS